jgi:Xaa-Pro aminopeptidase
MFVVRAALACGLCLTPLGAAVGISLDEYRDRRSEVRKRHNDGITILFGATEGKGLDLRTGFYQETNFYYLTGWREPGAILVLLPDRDILFLPGRDARAEKYTGKKTTADTPDVSSITGFEYVLAAESLEANIPRFAEAGRKVYAIFDDSRTEKLRALLPLRQFQDAAPTIARLRMKKSPAELALIERAVQATMDAHRAAWKRIASGLHEYQIAATMTNIFLESGCERSAYPPVVGSGPNAVADGWR